MRVKMTKDAHGETVFDNGIREVRLYEKLHEYDVTQSVGNQLWMQDACVILEGVPAKKPVVVEPKPIEVKVDEKREIGGPATPSSGVAES